MKQILVFLRGTISLLYVILNTLFWSILLYIVTFFRIILPVPAWRRFCARRAGAIAEYWTTCNNLILTLTRHIKIEVEGLENLNRDGWYLVLANHQSWVDIPILQKVFNRKVPMLKFFLKKELIKVPILGLAWWALDFPFMRRYSKDFLKKHPHLKGKDVEITRKACQKFRRMPVSILNFVEGTRFSEEKQKKQRSPFKHLLKPKAGGVGFVMTIMGDQLDSILDVTIHYHDGAKEFWDFLCGKVGRVTVKVNQYPITDDLRGNYLEDRDFRIFFQHWINEFWKKKDAYLDELISANPSQQAVDSVLANKKESKTV